MTVEERESLRESLAGLGFDVVRFAPASALVSGDFEAWLKAGNHADMAWLGRAGEKRADVSRIVESAKTVIALGVNYGSDRATMTQERWAKYSLFRDYHETIGRGLKAAGALLEESFAITRDSYRGYVDTGPVLERGWAAAAGLGWQGKNAMLISREYGNWLFLAEIITTLDIPPDRPLGEREPGEAPKLGHHCGSCTRCLEACPTDAFLVPGLVDSRRCISYQTIENRGIIPRELRKGIGPRVFGCDVCLDVCPWNRFARDGRSVLLKARSELIDVSLLDLLRMDQDWFSKTFTKTAIKRTKLVGLLRNACIAAGNWYDSDEWHFGDVSEEALLKQLLVLCRHEAAVVRAHAIWAVFRLAGPERANSMLANLRESESDTDVRGEFEAWSE